MEQNKGKGCDRQIGGTVFPRGMRAGPSEKATFGQKLE